MNRADRRAMERNLRHMKRSAAKVPGSIALRGGPMDGWVVKPGAPALQPDWRAKWIEEETRRAYERIRDGAPPISATPAWDSAAPPAWESLAPPEQDHYRDIVRKQYGDGRYEPAGRDELGVDWWEWRPA